MATLRKVGGPKKYFKYEECKKGQVLVYGKYIGRSPNKFGKENFDFKPVEGGATVCLNHSGHLAYLIETYCNVGDVVQVVYNGKQKLDKGPYKGKESHQFELSVEGDGETQLEMDFEAEEDQAEEEEEVEEVVEEKPKKKVAAKKAATTKATVKKNTGSVDLTDLD